MRPVPGLCLCLDQPRPGTASAFLMLEAIRRPFSTSAADRRSSIRELVHEPMKMASGRISDTGVPSSSPMYSSARVNPRRLVSSGISSSVGTRPLTDVTISGEVPHVTCGSMDSPSICSVLSKAAPSSECSVRHQSWAHAQSSPLGARACQPINVTSSTATNPHRAPADGHIAERHPTLHRQPLNGGAAELNGKAGATGGPISPITASAISFATTPGCSPPVTSIRKFFIFR